MTLLSTLLSSIVYAPLAVMLLPVAALIWLTDTTERRIELPNERWMLSRVALAQTSPVG